MNDVKKWIKEVRKLGYSNAEIKRELVNNGYDPRLADRRFDKRYLLIPLIIAIGLFFFLKEPQEELSITTPSKEISCGTFLEDLKECNPCTHGNYTIAKREGKCTITETLRDNYSRICVVNYEDFLDKNIHNPLDKASQEGKCEIISY